MGAVNCCVDAAAVDERAYSTCESTSASRIGVQFKRSVGQTERGKAVRTDSPRPAAPTEEQPAVCVSSQGSVVGQGTERHSESTVVEYKQRVHRQRKTRSTRRAQSLQYAPPEPTLWLSDYLCPCDPCPHSLCADRLLDTFYRDRPHEDANFRERDLLHRVLRGCGTFDERKVLDLELVLRAHRLTAALNGDEDKVFRAIVAPNKFASSRAVPLAEQNQVDGIAVGMRRSSAVTA